MKASLSSRFIRGSRQLTVPANGQVSDSYSPIFNGALVGVLVQYTPGATPLYIQSLKSGNTSIIENTDAAFFNSSVPVPITVYAALPDPGRGEPRTTLELIFANSTAAPINVSYTYIFERR